MLDLANDEVYFQRRLRLLRLQLWHHNVREQFTKVLNLRSLLSLVRLQVQIQQFVLQLPNLCKSLYDCKCHIARLFTLQDGGQHIEPPVGEDLRSATTLS